MKVQVEAPVQSTEDPEKVAQATAMYLPDPRIEHHETSVVAHGDDLSLLRKRVWELRIIDAFRGALLRGAQGDVMRFRTSKQAAFAGRVSLPPAPHSLGDLQWTVEVEDADPWDDAEALAWWLCPETKDGEIVGPMD